MFFMSSSSTTPFKWLTSKNFKSSHPKITNKNHHVLFKIYEWATQAYFIYSGEPEIRKKTPYGLIGPNGQPMSAATLPGGQNQFYSQHGPANMNMTSNLDDYQAQAYQNAENTMYADMSMYNARGGFQQQPGVPMGPKVNKYIIRGTLNLNLL